MTNEQNTSDSTTANETTAEQLRLRADRLCDLAAKIERSLVLTIGDLEPVCGGSLTQQLGERLLARNLHQLHQAADDVRITAYHFRQQADRFDLTSQPAA